MVSLPNIFQGSVESLPSNGGSSRSSGSNISTYFCNDCSYSLQLPFRHIDQHILREYEEKYAQIRYMQKILDQEGAKYQYSTEITGSPNGSTTSTFQISTSSIEKFQIYAFGFPLIGQSKLIPPQGDEYDWEHLRDKILKRHSRCNTLLKTPQMRQEEGAPRQARAKVRRLPSLGQKIRDTSKNHSPTTEHRAPRKILSADPEEVVFDHFEVGGFYEKKCKITNVSNEKCRFQILPFNTLSQFRVVYGKSTNVLPAGLSFYVTIQFLCRSIADTEDSFVIKSKDGEDLIVSIKAESDPPCLVEANVDNCNLEEVVDSLIDCGAHFVGEKGGMVLTLKNIGSSARFCFISESNWLDLDFTIDNSNTLIVDSFKIKPMYFSLKEDQEITIYVGVVPPSIGLHTTRVMLLCENGSLNNIDLICDGVLFEPSLIDHLNMLKLFDVDKPDIVYAECHLDLDKMLPFDTRYICFFLLNTANVSMSYHWELREVSVPGTEPLPEASVGLAPQHGRLQPQQAEMFCVKMNTDWVAPGVYRALLVLVVDDLPKKCIPLAYCDRLIPEKEGDDNTLRSIEAKYIELWLECVRPAFTLIPYVIDFTDFPITQGSAIETREIWVRNDSPGKLYLTWKCFEECETARVIIEPYFMQCDKDSVTACILSIEGVKEGPFEISYWCISGKGDAKVELKIKGYCCKPRITTLTDSIDFGLIKLEAHQTTAVVAKNFSSSDSFQWFIDELFFTSPDEGLVIKPDAPSNLSTNGGEICHKNSEILVKYHLPCNEDSLSCSVLNWDGNFIPVIADVHTPDVSINTYTLKADPIYLDVLCTMRVNVRNHSLISAAVFWGCPTDQNLQSVVTMEYEPRCFVLEPMGEAFVEIRVTPHVIGPLENLYIPCFVEGNPQPLLLKIEGTVEGLSIRVEFDSNDHHFCLTWPPCMTEDNDDISEKIMCACPPNSIQESDVSVDEKCIILPVDSDFSISLNGESDIGMLEEQAWIGTGDNNFNDVENSVHSIFINKLGDGDTLKETSVDEEDNISVASSVPYLNWPIVGGRYTRDTMDEEWEEQFNNLFTLEELRGEINNEKCVDFPPSNSLIFSDTPVRKPVTQTIYIRNDTAIPSNFEASVAYNFSRVYIPDGPEDAEVILKKSQGTYDEYLARATPNRGLTVFVTPEKGELLPDDYVTLSVTVVALSWGDYSDLIVLQVGDLNHLCVRISVSVPQPPVISPTSVGFGSLSLREHPVERRFTVQNVSTVPVYVCWDIFTPGDEALPISAMLFDNDPFDLQMTDYYGSNTSDYFHIMDKYTYLDPNSSKVVTVKYNPVTIDLDVDNEEISETIKAVLVGHVYLTDEGKALTDKDNCVRNCGSKLAPLKIDLEVQVELALLNLLNVFNYQLVFKCTANDVMKKKDSTWNSENVIRVQNISRTNLNAKVYTVGYFYVKKIEYTCSKEYRKSSKKSLFLKPGEICDVTLVCEVTASDILDCFEPPDPDNIEEEYIGVCSVEKGLLCFEQKDVRQDVKLELWLYPPLLQFSESALNFGPVYIEDTKVMIINITAPINEEYFEAWIVNSKNGSFYLKETSATLKPKIGYLLQVFFSPKACTFYQDTLVIRTCVEKMSKEIPLTGIGTFDYRYHTY